MRKLRIIGVLAISAGTLAILPATSASAADTTTTFSLTGGNLTITAQTTAPLGDKGASGTTSITGQLGLVEVTDARGSVAGWDASASSTAFTNAGSTSTGINYTGGAVNVTGSVTVPNGPVTAMTGVAAEVVSTTAANGNNTASWNPTLAVTLPSTSLAGTYSGVVTTSVV